MELDGHTFQDKGDEDSELNVDRCSVIPRPIMDTLLDISQEHGEKQICQPRVEMLLDSPKQNPENAQLHGWVTFPLTSLKPSGNHEQKKRKSSLYSGPTDIEDYLFKKKSYVLLPDYWHPGVMWRSIVERDTYRYVDDNGCYRYLKTNAELGKDQSEVTGQFQKQHLSLSQAQREIQREITRDLHRVVESREGRAKTHTARNDVELNRAASSPLHLVVEKLDDPDDKPDPVSELVKDIPKAYLEDVGEDCSDSTFQLPSVDVPLLSKAFADRLMENFTSKISVLEEQIRKDAKIKMLQKSTKSTSLDISPFHRSSLQDLIPETVNDINQSNLPGLDKKCSFPQSTFQIVKVFSGPGKNEQKMPLKPLEKVTPGLRQVDDMHKMQVAHLRYNSVKGNSDNSTTTRYTFNDSLVNPFHLKEVLKGGEKVNLDSNSSKDDCLNMNDLAVLGAVKSRDAGFAGQGLSQSEHKRGQANVKKPKRSKSFLNEPVEKNSTGFHSAPVGKPKRDSKKDAQNIARPGLPELMGKKMPVTVSIQKWL